MGKPYVSEVYELMNEEWPDIPSSDDMYRNDKVKMKILLDSLERLSTVVKAQALESLALRGDDSLLHRCWWRSELVIEEVCEALMREMFANEAKKR